MPTTLKPEVNIPVTLAVTGAVIWPGKEWKGKPMPAQLALKGTLPGTRDEVTIYVPVDLAGFLVTAGATHREVQTKDGVKGQAYDLPANRRTWVICKRQPAGAKYPHVELYEPDAPPVAPSAQPLTEVPKALQTPPEAMPWDGKPAVHLERDPGEMTPMETLFALYDECAVHAIALAKEHPEVQWDVTAAIATLFIQASKLK